MNCGWRFGLMSPRPKGENWMISSVGTVAVSSPVRTNGMNFSFETLRFRIDPGNGKSMCWRPEVADTVSLNGSSAPHPSSMKTNSLGQSWNRR